MSSRAIARSVGHSAFQFIFCISIMAGGVCILLSVRNTDTPCYVPLTPSQQCRFRYHHINHFMEVVCFALHRGYLSSIA